MSTPSSASRGSGDTFARIDATDHPRLYLRARAGTDSWGPSIGVLREKANRLPSLWNTIVRKSERALGSPPLVPPDPDGWLYDILDLASERMIRSALVYLVTGDRRYRESALLQARCIIVDWPWIERYHAEKVGLHADLRTGVILYSIAILYDWLHDELDSSYRTLFIEAFKRAFDLYKRDLDADAFYFTSYGSNWLAVMLGGYGAAALALGNDLPGCDVILDLSIQRCDGMLDRIGRDGGWEEGVFYWGGLVRLAKFYHLLYTAGDSEIETIRDPRFVETCYFPIYMSMAPNGRADFGDARFPFDHAGAPLFALIAAVARDEALQWAYHEYRENVNGEKQLEMGIGEIRPDDETYQFICLDPGLASSRPTDKPMSRLFQNETYGFYVSRNGWGRSDESLTIAAKGHGFVRADAKPAIEHEFISLFYFTEKLEAELKWKMSPSGNEFCIDDDVSFSADETRYTASSDCGNSGTLVIPRK